MKPYKGYVGSIEYSVEDKCFHGSLVGIQDVVTFESDMIEGLQQAFEASVDDYLEWCAELGQSPKKPKSGKLAVRLAPEIHEMVSTAAVSEAKSVNQWISDTLADAAEKQLQDNSIKIKIR